MSEQSNPAPEQPAQVVQTRSEKQGAANIESDAFARMIASKQVVPKAPEPVTPKEEAKAAPAPEPTETSSEPAAEAQPEETPDAAQAAAAESEEEANEVLSPETHSLDPKLQAKIDRRIGKEVAKRKALEAQVAELQSKVAAIPEPKEEPVIVPIPANVPLPDIQDLASLEKLKVTAKQEIRWAEAWLDEDIPAEGIQTDRGHVTKRQLKELIRNARTVQEDLIPQRESFLQTKAAAKQQAYEKFPFLKDPSQPGYAEAKQAYKENPWLHGLPNADYIVGVQVKGLLALKAEEASKVAKAAPSKPKPKPTSGQSEVASDSSASRVPVGALNAAALVEEDKSLAGRRGVSAKEFAASLVRKSQLRNSR